MPQADACNSRVASAAELSLFDIEGDISDLCRAIKVVSCIIADQLQRPDSLPELSDYGLEVQSFKIDASMVRYAVDHAAELALALRDKVDLRNKVEAT